MPLKKGKTGLFLSCACCGKKVYVPQYRLSTFKYCSRSCLARGTMIKGRSICLICGKEFEYNSCRSNTAKYCSRSCYYKAQHLKGTVIEYCKNCGEPFRRAPSKKRVFCSRACKIAFNNNHWSDSFYSAKKCLKVRGLIKVCEECGYSEHPEILGVHHKDGNHSNNTLSNLAVLCPNCHSLKHCKHVTHGGYKNAT